MFRRWSLISLVTLLVLSLLSSASAETVFEGGSGTAEDPWQIATAEQLDRVRDDLTAHYSGAPVVSVSMYLFIIMYRIPMPPMTTRLTITVQNAPLFVFFTPWSVRA